MLVSMMAMRLPSRPPNKLSAAAFACRSFVQVASRASFVEPRGLVLVDLENVSSIKADLSALYDHCRLVGVQLRTYTSNNHGLAPHATDIVSSGKKDAVDFQIAMDAAKFIQTYDGSGAKVLIVTNDHFGETVESINKDVAAAKINSPLPSYWKSTLQITQLSDMASHMKSSTGCDVNQATKCPVSRLNELKQASGIESIEFLEKSRTPGKGLFQYECRVQRCKSHGGAMIAVVGQGTHKKEAKAATATKVLGQLQL